MRSFVFLAFVALAISMVCASPESEQALAEAKNILTTHFSGQPEQRKRQLESFIAGERVADELSAFTSAQHHKYLYISLDTLVQFFEAVKGEKAIVSQLPKGFAQEIDHLDELLAKSVKKVDALHNDALSRAQREKNDVADFWTIFKEAKEATEHLVKDLNSNAATLLGPSDREHKTRIGARAKALIEILIANVSKLAKLDAKMHLLAGKAFNPTKLVTDLNGAVAKLALHMADQLQKPGEVITQTLQGLTQHVTNMGQIQIP